MASALNRPTSVGVGLATIALVGFTYGQFCPKVAELRSVAPANREAQGSEKAARWTAGALVVLVSVISRDVTVFVMGGGALIAFSWQHRYADAYNPEMGAASSGPSSRALVHAGDGLHAGYTPGG